MIHPANISIDAFHYDLPEERIAVHPLPERDASKLLVYKNGTVTDDLFRNLADHLPAGALLVFNNSRVIKARLRFPGGGKPIEIFCLAALENGDSGKGFSEWECLVGGLKKWRAPVSVERGGVTLRATLLSRLNDSVNVRFEWQPESLDFADVLEAVGEIPLPPYLRRAATADDNTRYQTAFARESGSVAAPTAGLHFTPGTLASLEGAAVERIEITLHVGAGTFKPVKSATLEGHEMHEEEVSVSLEALKKLREKIGDTIVAVGTTSLRALETFYWMGVRLVHDPHRTPRQLEIDQWEPYLERGEIAAAAAFDALIRWMEERGVEDMRTRTSILIAPPYRMHAANGLITNFHQPKSTLLLLVSALVGDDWRGIYAHALQNGYRFLSYGDASLLLADR